MNPRAEDISTVINSFIHEAQTAAGLFAHESGLAIKYEHIEDALQDVLDLNDSADLLDRKLNAEQIHRLLAAYDFRRFFPKLLGQFEVKRSIIPPDCIQRLDEQTVVYRGQLWRVHKNDADPFPSDPHAHNVESGLALHLLRIT